MSSSNFLPVESITPELLSLIEKHNCVLSAPPGAGKSTYLPLALLALPFFANKTILLLQPRQVAVRAIAHFLASSVDEKVGQSVGYQMRGESALSKHTRLCVITEGLLVARLQSDPELNDVGLIIFDEFHERSVQSDVALGLSIEVQSGLREDLRLLIMSATLNINDIMRLMPDAKQLSCSGRTYPIDYIYRPPITTKVSFGNPQIQVINHVVNTVVEAFNTYSGNILVFLSGASLINKVQKALENTHFPSTIIAPLFGALSPQQQKQAINSPPTNMRKIVLATNIAETSLTIDGVSIVIDSGQEKFQRFVVPRKLNQLSEQMISKASSIQRAGRAGRQSEGVCYRLWSHEQQQFLQENTPAKITQEDISQTLLTLLEWGSDFTQLPLIDTPSRAQIDYSYALLIQLGFVSPEHHITQLGKLACQYNTHPRLARLLISVSQKTPKAIKILSAIVVAIIEGKPLSSIMGSNEITAQCAYVIRQMSSTKQHGAFDYQKDITRIAKQLGVDHVSIANLQQLPHGDDMAQTVANLLLWAFPDRIGYKRKTAGYTIADGTGAEFSYEDEGNFPQWVLCTQTQLTHKTNGIIRQYCELPSSVVSDYLASNTQHGKQQYWDTSLDKVVCKKIARIGAIEISSQVCSFSANEETSCLILKQIRHKGLTSLLANVNRLRARIMLLKSTEDAQAKEFPEVDLTALLATMETWLLPYLADVTSWQQLSSLNWADIIHSIITYSQLQYLNEHYPTHFMAPTGNKHALDYSETGKVILAIRIQELYGLKQHPSLGKGKLPITLSLLSPAHRIIQKTADLPNFWIGSYKDVQKDMKGQYPRHYWPDVPQNALPTTKTKKKM